MSTTHDADLARRVEDLEAEKNLDRRLMDYGPPPPIMSESNRLLAEAYQRRQAELREQAEAEQARLKLEEERERLHAYEEWLSQEPERATARIQLADVREELSEAEAEAAPYNQRVRQLEDRIRELRAIAES